MAADSTTVSESKSDRIRIGERDYLIKDNRVYQVTKTGNYLVILLSPYKWTTDSKNEGMSPTGPPALVLHVLKHGNAEALFTCKDLKIELTEVGRQCLADLGDRPVWLTGLVGIQTVLVPEGSLFRVESDPDGPESVIILDPSDWHRA